MPTPTAGLVEIILSGTQQGRPWANVFHYWNPSDTQVLSLPPIATQFNTVPNQWALSSVSGVTFDNIKIKDVLGDLPDFDMVPTQPVGQLAVEGVANFVGIRFDYNVGSKETRRGYKRLVGLAESSVADGTIGAGALASFQTFATTYLEASLTVGATNYEPVVLGGPTKDDPLRFVVNLVIAVTVLSRVTTQNSRK